METYTVGGWVRDKLLGKFPKDRDYLIVGATQKDLEWILCTGSKQVGKDFPVFLDVQGNEWALARTERKTGVGYAGFETYSGNDVTLEQDLARRDLTINSMAFSNMSKLFGEEVIIDPYGGLKDLRDKVLRHTTEAFAEDPVRVLRVARFMARFGPEWCIHPSTLELMDQIRDSGELDALQPDRVWLEMSKALTEPHPELFFTVLMNSGIFPEYERLSHVPQPLEHHPEGLTHIHTNMVMQQAVKGNFGPEVVFASLCHDFGKVIYFDAGNLHGHETYGVPIVKKFCEKWKVPNKFKELALISTEFHGKVHAMFGRDGQNWIKPNSIMKLFEESGALKQVERFKQMLQVCECDAKGRGGMENREYPIRPYLEQCLEAVLAVDTKEISLPMVEAGKTGTLIGEAIRVARIHEIRLVQIQKKWEFL